METDKLKQAAKTESIRLMDVARRIDECMFKQNQLTMQYKEDMLKLNEELETLNNSFKGGTHYIYYINKELTKINEKDNDC